MASAEREIPSARNEIYLDPDAIRRRLTTRRLGQPLYAFESISSTNQVCWRLALDGYPEGTLVVAEQQTRGRGRRGRQWHSPRGLGLWFSVLLRPHGHARYSWLLPLAMSIPVAVALRKLFHLGACVKWPNDVCVGKRKLAGVLVEGSVSRVSFDQAVVGVGVNVNQGREDFPRDLGEQATSVRLELGRSVDRIGLLVQILEEMERVYFQLVRDEQPVLQEWRELCSHLGKRVRVTGPFGTREGVFVDLGPDGSILLRSPSGREEILRPDDLFQLEEPECSSRLTSGIPMSL
ncbi:MAG: biotin--[acetyl-CoA-carboxylase] ligase [candidate division KSB1 bacterium]|nr:biotin--[acetyl-CoA-carboxylase] ligase [candidate division KSB1 bacterium]